MISLHDVVATRRRAVVILSLRFLLYYSI